MKSIINKVLNEFADKEVCYTTEALSEAISDRIKEKYDVKKKKTSFSHSISINAASEGLFHGETFVPERDYQRLKGQLKRVYDAMKLAGWVTDHQISKLTGDPQASVQARRRDFRKMGMQVDAKEVGRGLWKYRLNLE